MASVPPTPQEPGGVWAKVAPTVDELWAQFEVEFPTESDSIEELYGRARELDIIRCESCESSDFQRVYGSREITCNNCGEKKSFTAGTFFDGIRRVRAWLAAIWMKENGASLTSAKLHRLVGIAYSSAWNILKKVNAVVQEKMEEGHDVASTFFSVTYCKRSRETPAREHPLAEQEALEKRLLDDLGGKVSESGKPADDGVDCNVGATELRSADSLTGGLAGASSSAPAAEGGLGSLEKAVYNLLSTKPVSFGRLCRTTGMSADELSVTLTMLQLAGLVTSMPGEKYVCNADKQPVANNPAMRTLSKSIKCSSEIEAIIEDFIGFIRVDHHGISRKYVQNYLASYWCHKDRARWPVGELLKACLKFRCISSNELLDYVSPLIVKLLPLQLLGWQPNSR